MTTNIISSPIASSGGSVNLSSGNLVVVNSLSDLPAPSGGSHQLADNTTYQFRDFVSSPNALVGGQNTALVTPNASTTGGFTYTGTGVAFTANLTGDNAVSFVDFSFGAPNASRLFDITGGITFFRQTTITSGTTLGNFINCVAFIIREFRAVTITGGGFTFSGSNGFVFDVVGVNVRVAAATSVIDFGSVLWDTLNIANFTPQEISAGGIAVSGNSTNSTAGNIARVELCNFSQITTPLSGIATTDVQWRFRENSGIDDSVSDLFAHTTASITVTVGGGNQGVFFPITDGGSPWVGDRENRFSVDSDGIATYTGIDPIDIIVDGNSSVEKVGGGSNEIELRINVDTGSGFPATPPSLTKASTRNSTPTNVVPQHLLRIENGDRIQLWGANLTGTSNFICSESTKLRIANGF